MGASNAYFPVRGVIEGFYGNPWTREQRLDLVDFIAAHGMNTFVYAPKDDPLVRRAWRQAYNGADLERFTELFERCREQGIELVYGISPGLSIRYSDADDVAALTGKLMAVAALGVRQFALLLDDIPSEVQHAEDRAVFATLADAHVHLVNAVLQRLDPRASLVVCPTVYWGRGDEPYVVRLGQGIDPRVELYWTGRAICSPTIDLEDAELFSAATGRSPLYWDNYPVNDVAMGFELHIGPYQGRDPELWRAARGVISNGMELFEASKIPFATIADFLDSPETYDPETSWQRALLEIVGPNDLEAFALFADNTRSSCLSTADAPIVARALEQFAFRLEQGDGVAASADLRDLADRLLGAAGHLLRGPVRNTALIEECRPWIEAFELGAQAMVRTAELASTGGFGAAAQADLRTFLAELRQRRVRVFGDALDMFLSDLTVTHVRPGRHLALQGGGNS